VVDLEPNTMTHCFGFDKWCLFSGVSGDGNFLALVGTVGGELQLLDSVDIDGVVNSIA
jgi:hypothetical protein